MGVISVGAGRRLDDAAGPFEVFAEAVGGAAEGPLDQFHFGGEEGVGVLLGVEAESGGVGEAVEGGAFLGALWAGEIGIGGEEELAEEGIAGARADLGGDVGGAACHAER